MRKKRMTHTSPDLRSAILSVLESSGLSMNAWSKRAGIRESTLRNFLAGRTNTLNASTVVALANAADTEVSDLLSGNYGSITEKILVRTATTGMEWTAAQVDNIQNPIDIVVPKDPRFPNIRRIGVMMNDPYLDADISLGSIAIITAYGDIERQPTLGDLVYYREYKEEEGRILERHNIRRLEEADGYWWLKAKTTNDLLMHRVPANLRREDGMRWARYDDSDRSVDLFGPVLSGYLILQL